MYARAQNSRVRTIVGGVAVVSVCLLPLACGSGEEEMTVDQAQHDRRVDYVEFTTTDMDRTKAFYSEIFGWEFTDYGPDYSSFSDGRLQGGFVLGEQVVRGGALVVIYATDLEALVPQVKQHGGAIVQEIFEFPGGRRFHFTDPSGNELAIWSDR